MNNDSVIIILNILIIFIFSTGCVDNDRNETIESNYSELKIEITSGINFTLLIPVLYELDTNQSIESVYNELKVVEGEAVFQIQNSFYGIGLNISGNGKITLRSYLSNSDFLHYPFSMQKSIDNNINKNGNIEYWIYMDSFKKSDIEIDIDFTSTHDYGGYIVNIRGTITNGWNILEGQSYAGGA